jgi:hypothetical protein
VPGRHPEVAPAPIDAPPRKSTWRREELLHLLSLSGTLAGLCITGVTLFHTLARASLPETIADDLLAIAALVFLVCTYVIFFALRTHRETLARTLEKVADGLFLLALTGMVGSGFIMVYTVI